MQGKSKLIYVIPSTVGFAPTFYYRMSGGRRAVIKEQENNLLNKTNM